MRQRFFLGSRWVAALSEWYSSRFGFSELLIIEMATTSYWILYPARCRGKFFSFSVYEPQKWDQSGATLPENKFVTSKLCKFVTFCDRLPLFLFCCNNFCSPDFAGPCLWIGEFVSPCEVRRWKPTQHKYLQFCNFYCVLFMGPLWAFFDKIGNIFSSRLSDCQCQVEVRDRQKCHQQVNIQM